MSNTALNRTTVGLLANKSGGSVAQGDVVIVDSANAAAFTTTTTAAYTGGSIGVVLDPNGIASNAIGTVAFGGVVPIVNLSGSASLGDLFKTHSVAKQALRHAGPIIAGDFGQVLGTGTAPAAFLFNQPSAVASGGSTTFAGDTDVSLSGLANLDQIQYQTGDSKFHNVKGGMVRLDAKTPTTGATVTFSGISGAYSSLRLEFQGRCDGAVTGDSLYIQFNADTGANYDWQQNYGAGTSAGASAQVAQNGGKFGIISGASAPSGSASAVACEIPNYAGATFQKTYLARSTEKDANINTSLAVIHVAGFWRNTAAITSITVGITGASNFVTGTTLYLWGLV